MDNIDIIIDNIKQMLLGRNDNIDELEEHEVDIDRDQFYNSIIEFHTSNTTIIFALTKQLRKNILAELNDDDIMKFVNKYNNKYNIVLVFNNDNISTPYLHTITKFDKHLQKQGGHLQYFHMKNLMFNPTKHILVPKHTKLTPEEITDVMTKYLIKSKIQMPYILRNDIIAKWLGLKQGDVVKIERFNENSGVSYYYRVCV